MRWLQRFAKMRQDFQNRPQFGDEADQPDIVDTVGTRQRKLLTQPYQQLDGALVTSFCSESCRPSQPSVLQVTLFHRDSYQEPKSVCRHLQGTSRFSRA